MNAKPLKMQTPLQYGANLLKEKKKHIHCNIVNDMQSKIFFFFIISLVRDWVFNVSKATTLFTKLNRHSHYKENSPLSFSKLILMTLNDFSHPSHEIAIYGYTFCNLITNN